MRRGYGASAMPDLLVSFSGIPLHKFRVPFPRPNAWLACKRSIDSDLDTQCTCFRTVLISRGRNTRLTDKWLELQKMLGRRCGAHRLLDSPEVLVFYRERTNSTKLHSRDQCRGALSIKRLEGGCCACGGGGDLWKLNWKPFDSSEFRRGIRSTNCRPDTTFGPHGVVIIAQPVTVISILPTSHPGSSSHTRSVRRGAATFKSDWGKLRSLLFVED